jgi:2,3-diaminopropionate biosynthesis protein SbnB
LSGDGILVLGGQEVEDLLRDREEEIVGVVAKAYIAHGEGQSSLPHSTFLRFPNDEVNRIIALPAFLGDRFEVAGLKWIASFPNNIRQGLARASALLILNDCDNGRPEIILEGSIISARRTAASAALAASTLLPAKHPQQVGLIGTGVINFQIARFLHILCAAESFLVYDVDMARAGRFAAALRKDSRAIEVRLAKSMKEILSACPLVSFATTAVHPHVSDLSSCQPDTTILHISLRDLAPEAILACDNVVDDADHVCRAQTSMHLAEQATGGREFIRCALADILVGRVPARRGDGTTAVFNPFGLGILDIAVGQLVAQAAITEGRGSMITSFFPAAGEFSA